MIVCCATICRRVSCVHAGDHKVEPVGSGTATQLVGLVSLMRGESAVDHLGGRAMLNALSTAMFALVLRLACEADEAPVGLLALAADPRLGPALAALFDEPARAWSLPTFQHVARDAGAPVPGEAWTIRQSSLDRHPHGSCSQ